ncbi:GNAT family N-acetyltransferase [Halobacillus amylolyticus]|uniref:GNAT family N-acetyltransferase n=1 Tax=Halobacillus amylolyticus TaxID=2932259 RepID=A0ABY4HC47_9BACI|nr:GNAT family N-acetyltransferase [Halobacillus amylolyticus]UOR12412.1 GNAT family N-acetyltransferase [Halobacillus amylolyticus]
MFIRYKKSFEKIAMGLLSFMPECKDVKKLQEIISEYETNSSWYLFLWKEEDILGTIGVRIEEGEAVIQHVSVSPSHRNLGIGKKMYHHVCKHFEKEYLVCSDEYTESFLEKCDTESSSSSV